MGEFGDFVRNIFLLIIIFVIIYIILIFLGGTLGESLVAYFDGLSAS